MEAMIDREKLIAMLGQCSCIYSPPCTGECGECNNVEMYDEEIAHIADHLIANGVVVREKGEWKVAHIIGEQLFAYDPFEYDVFMCSVCGEEADVSQALNFCPNCGSDMRKDVE